MVAVKMMYPVVVLVVVMEMEVRTVMRNVVMMGL
jgi:hypothetical protein